MNQAALHVRRTRIKFCGLTREEDVLAALDLGVDAFGFNLAKGPRRITASRAAELAALLPPAVTAFALFVDADEASILTDLRASTCRVVQLHGSERTVLAERLRVRGFQVVKAFQVRDAATLAKAQGYPCDLPLLDAWVDGMAGGSGQTWDWSLLQAWQGKPYMLAGGLRPENVGHAVKSLRPFAVDVSSGIEEEPGIKCARRMRDFVLAVRAADQEASHG